MKFVISVATIFVVLLFLAGIPRYPDGCDSASLFINLNRLQTELKHHLYGQPTAIDIILEELEKFQVTVEPLLVYVLLGGSGTGKTWTTQLISRALTSSPDQSATYKEMTLHLEPWASEEEIVRSVRYISTHCCSWNFLFVEDSDFAGPRQIDILLEELNHIRLGGNNISCANRKVVVMLTSNYGQRELAQLAFDEIQRSGNTSALHGATLEDAARKIQSPIVDGLAQSDIPFTAVPYLPLGKSQVKQCIIRDLQQKKKPVSSATIDKILQNLRFLPAQLEYFATSGCKPISTQVNLHL